jgi:hypothetical protein
MSAKQLLRVAVVLVAVLFLWGVMEIVNRRSDRLARIELIPPLAVTDVDTVEIVSPSDTIRLSRTPGGAWRVNGFEASRTGVEALFNALGDSLRGELVAQSASSHGRMGVDSAEGRHMRFVGGGVVLASLIAGHAGQGFQTRYVRRPGENEVYLLHGEFATMLDRDVPAWREKEIGRVEPDSVATMSAERAGRAYTLTRAEGGWRFADGAAADTAAVRRALDAYRGLAAQGVSFATPAQADSADFTSPDRRVTLLGLRGDTLLALALDSTASGFWVRKAGSEAVYHLYGWKVDDLVPADTTLRSEK